MRTEHEIQQDFKDLLEMHGCYVRILQANMLMAGMPDMFLAPRDGRLILVENKRWDRKFPPSDPIESFRPLLRPAQRSCIIANLWTRSTPVYVIAWTQMGMGYVTNGKEISYDSIEHLAEWFAK